MDNPITDWTVAIAQSRGDTIGWEQQIINGSPLAMRTKGDGSHPGTPPWNGYSHGSAKNRDGVQGSLNVLTELATPSRLPQGQAYDTLLVTERHDPLNTVQWENTIGYLRHYHDRLAEHSDTSRTLLYQVWPDIDKGNPQPWLDYARVELVVWECIAEKANLSLEAEGRTRSVAVIPGSVILARFVEEVLDGTIPGVSGLNDVFTDNVHLTAAGQYLIAATFYAAAYGKSPVGAKAATGLSESTMEAIEQLAWGEVSTYFESGYPEGRPLSECRTYVAEEVCPAHYSIRGQQTPNCSYWSSGDSPLNFPDDDFLYPAP